MALNSRRRAAAALVGLLALVTACGSDSGDDETADPGTTTGATTEETAANSDEPVRMVWIGPLSGPAGPFGSQQAATFQASVDRINEEGGILGREVVAEILNSEGDATKAVTLLREAQASGPIDLLYPGLTSNESLALLPITSRENILTIGPAGADAIGVAADFPLHFGLNTQLGAEGGLWDTMTAQMADDGVETVATIFANDALGQSNHAVALEFLEENGIEEVVTAEFAPADLDMTAQVARVLEEDADALLFDGLGRSALAIFTAIQQSGTDIPLYLGPAGAATNYTGQISDELLARTQVAFYSITMEGHGGADPAKIEQLLADAEAHDVDLTTSDILILSLGHDMPLVYAAAAESAGSTEPEAIAEVLRTESFPKADGPFLAFDYGWTADSNFVAPGPTDVAMAFVIRTADRLLTPVEG